MNGIITAITFKDVQLNGCVVYGSWDAKDGDLRLHGIRTYEELKHFFNMAPEAELVAPEEPKPVPAKIEVVEPLSDRSEQLLERGMEDASAGHVEPVPESIVSAPDGLAVFGTLQRLGEIVAHIVKCGARNFVEVKDFIQKLQDTEACPALDALLTQAGEKFEVRLRNQCLAQNVPGA